jgi:hypothetical protein
MLHGKEFTVTLIFDLWPWKTIGFQTLIWTKYVLSLVKIHWRMLILECSQGCYGRTDEWTEGRTDGSVTICLRNFVGEGIINEPSYEMVGVKMTVTYYGQNNRIFGIFFLVDFLFSSLTTPNVFIVMILKCTCILIIIYTFCTCDTLVPTRILNSEISWFCFDFPKWGPVSFIITDFNVFVQFFE